MRKRARIVSSVIWVFMIMALFTGCNSVSEKGINEILSKVNKNNSYDFNMIANVDIKLKSGGSEKDKERIKEISKKLVESQMKLRGSAVIKNEEEGEIYLKQQVSEEVKQYTNLECWIISKKDYEKSILDIKPFMKKPINKTFENKQYLTQEYTREALTGADFSTIMLSNEIHNMKKSIMNNNVSKLRFKEDMMKKQQGKKINVNGKELTATLYSINMNRNKVKELFNNNGEFYKNNKEALDNIKKDFKNKLLNQGVKKEELASYKDFNFIGEEGVKIEYYIVNENLVKIKMLIDFQESMDNINKRSGDTLENNKDQSKGLCIEKFNMEMDIFNHGKATVNIPECNVTNSMTLIEYNKAMNKLMFGY